MTKYRKDEKTSYCLGTTLTFELLLRKPEAATRIYISPKQKRDETYQKLVSLARANHVAVIENNERIFRDLSDKDNVMVIGEFEKWDGQIDAKENHIVLVNPSNMGNLGTIIRTSIGFSLPQMALIEPCCDIFDPKVIRASMGAIFSLRFKRYKDFASYLLDAEGHTLYPFMLQATTDLKTVAPKAPWSIVFGNEATGLSQDYLKVGEPVIIPHSPLVDSLNLDNAVAIGVYWFTK